MGVRGRSGFFAGNRMKTPSPHPALGHPPPPGEGLKTASHGTDVSSVCQLGNRPLNGTDFPLRSTVNRTTSPAR